MSPSQPFSRFRLPPRAVAALFLLTLAEPVPAQTSPPSQGPPEVRAVWVDGFHAGIRSAQEVSELVETARRARLNTLFVQVRRRGDALYTGGLEPPLDDPSYDPSFDGLAAVVEAAHAAGLEVHAWINAMPIWRDAPPPKHPGHVFNLHGTDQTGEECWLTRSREGVQKFPVGYFLDPGHPAARDHLVRVYLDVVRRYRVDGIHFDYIRYPETEAVLPRGSDVGYNAISVARFQKATGRSDLPEPGDERWTAWRREQVTQLVRRIYVEARALNPGIVVSAATIAWGKPPATLAEFPDAAPMQRVFQDWRGWLAEGVLDMAVPMNYARERDARVRGWFDGWIDWEKRHKADRQLVIGIGGYLNSPEDVLAQVGRARAPSKGKTADGVSVFSFFRPSGPPPTANAEALPASASPDRLDFLARGVAGGAPAFAAPAEAPAQPWLRRPTRGLLAGTAKDAEGRPLDGATVQLRRTGWFRKTRRLSADASGWFGAAQLAPGTYTVRLELPDGRPAREQVKLEVRAGAVARAELRRQ